MGGGYPTLEDFHALYGLNLHFGFLMPFCLTDEEKKTDRRHRYTHIDAFCLYWCICPSVCALSCIMYARMCMLG